MKETKSTVTRNGESVSCLTREFAESSKEVKIHAEDAESITLLGPGRDFTVWVDSETGDVLTERRNWKVKFEIPSDVLHRTTLALMAYRGFTNSLQRSFRSGELDWRDYLTGEEVTELGLADLPERKVRERKVQMPENVLRLQHEHETLAREAQQAREAKKSAVADWLENKAELARQAHQAAYDKWLAESAK